MNTIRKFVELDQLTGIVDAAFGSARRLNTVERLRGGRSNAPSLSSS